jgi:putative flavoprotein involved in K+ transport
MVVVGKLRGVSDTKLFFAPDLQSNLDLAEACYSELTSMMRDYAHTNGLNLPVEDPPEETVSSTPELANPIGELDMVSAGITSLIWCTGFRYDFGIVKPKVLDEFGRPVHTRGVTRCAGFYFLGLRDMYTMRSSHLSGVGDDAAHIAGLIARR